MPSAVKIVTLADRDRIRTAICSNDYYYLVFNAQLTIPANQARKNKKQTAERTMTINAADRAASEVIRGLRARRDVKRRNGALPERARNAIPIANKTIVPMRAFIFVIISVCDYIRPSEFWIVDLNLRLMYFKIQMNRISNFHNLPNQVRNQFRKHGRIFVLAVLIHKCVRKTLILLKRKPDLNSDFRNQLS